MAVSIVPTKPCLATVASVDNSGVQQGDSLLMPVAPAVYPDVADSRGDFPRAQVV